MIEEYRMKTIKNMPRSEQPREKLLAAGVESLSNSELIAILLSTGAKELTAINLAENILNYSNDGLRFLTDTTVEELSNIKGMGLAKSAQLIAAVELGKRIALSTKVNNYRIKTPADVGSLLMEELRYKKKEYFNILLLNTKHELISIENISIGSLNASIVHPREVFQRAIKRSSSAIILVHNHPSGDPSPSNEDIKITKRLQEAGNIVGIDVLDHIVIGDGNFCSLKEKQLL